MSKLILVICSSLSCGEFRSVWFLSFDVDIHLPRNKGHDMLFCFLKKHQTNRPKNPNLSKEPSLNRLKPDVTKKKKNFIYFVQSVLKHLLTKGFFITLWEQFHRSYCFPDDVSGENEAGVWNHFSLASTENNINILFHAHIIPCNQQDYLNVGSKKQKAG